MRHRTEQRDGATPRRSTTPRCRLSAIRLPPTRQGRTPPDADAASLDAATPPPNASGQARTTELTVQPLHEAPSSLCGFGWCVAQRQRYAISLAVELVDLDAVEPLQMSPDGRPRDQPFTLPRGPPVGALLPRPIVAPLAYALKVATSLVLTGDLTPGGCNLAGVIPLVVDAPPWEPLSRYVTTNQGTRPRRTRRRLPQTNCVC